MGSNPLALSTSDSEIIPKILEVVNAVIMMPPTDVPTNTPTVAPTVSPTDVSTSAPV